ncbi:MAG: phage integrase N-terminal SAM-like domain-containing protein [Gammaproteobacteria bacterium]|nr:phage integrase N-terminal SAM-like domain-containing protein [Gammaproteobacteria bacterium]
MSNVVTKPNAPTKNTSAEAPKLKPLDKARARIRRLNYNIHTEDTYVDWVRRLVLFHTKHHPRDMGATAIETFLTHLAVVGKVSASTQNPTKRALLLRYRGALGQAPDGG